MSKISYPATTLSFWVFTKKTVILSTDKLFFIVTPFMDIRMRTIGLFLMLVLSGLQYKLWFGGGSIFQWTKLEHKLTLQVEKNNKIAAQNRAIEADITELKSGDQALEEQARYDLGMVKQGEVYYQFV